MKALSFLLATALVAAVSGQLNPHHVKRNLPAIPRPRHGYPIQPGQMHKPSKRQRETIIPQNANTTKFAVNGSAIPEVDFDVGESYAGLMPIGNDANSTDKLWFWFFPSANPNATDEITIWLNGGPGCSSLKGFLQANGPFTWQYGTYKPVRNPWTWVNLTNMIWVEQPIGTGFTQGTQTANSSADVAQQFLGFFKNFQDTFGLQNKKIYIAGESYAGFYVPYLADAMFDRNDTRYFDIQGTLLYDPIFANWDLQGTVPMLSFVERYADIFNLNTTTMASLRNASDACGYTDYFSENLVFPPKGPFPDPTPSTDPGCDLWTLVFEAVSLVNPCFDLYHITTTCPIPWDVLGFPGSFDYLPEGGATIYFNRSDVRAAINAPPPPTTDWVECRPGVLPTERSQEAAWAVYPRVIEKSKRTVLAHGSLDFILLSQGGLLAVQNMTWAGKQGFQDAPHADFFVPYHDTLSVATAAASGVMGLTHHERGFTWVETFLAGHAVPQNQPSAAYRQLEFLLGRIESLEERGDFTTQGTDFGTY